MRKLLILLFFPIALVAQTTTKGTIISGPAAARPVCSPTFNATTANSGDIYNDTDDVNTWKCMTGTWSVFGGGITGVQNNGSTLATEPFINFLAPLTATTNSGNQSNDVSCPVYVGVGGSHSSGCMIDPGASGSGTDYPGRDAAWHPAAGGSTVKPDPSTAIMYVAVTCNGGVACSDSNDGLSWGTAKLTVYNAACSFPGGNCGTQTAGSGTIFIGPGSSANPTAGAGLWLMGVSDPNYSSGTTTLPGWLACNSCAIYFDGVPDAVSNPNGHFPTAPLFGGSAADRNHPGLWLAGTFSLRFDNLAFLTNVVGIGRPIVLGECSDHTRANCGVNGVALNYDTGYTVQGGTFGPCMDISSNSYWMFIDHFGCTGNSGGSNGYTANNAAAILIDGTGNNGSGLIFIDHCNFDDGGLKFIPGLDGGGFSIKNCTEESSGPSLPPAAWMTAFPTGTYAYAESLLVTDNPNPVTIFQNDDTTGGSRGFPIVINTPDVLGPAVGTGFITSTSPNATTLVTRKYGPSAATTPQRATPLTPTRFTNAAYSNPASWTVSSGSVTITTGVSDPFGGTGAATLTSAGGGTVNLSPTIPVNSGAVGSWVLFGAWLQNGGWSANTSGFLLQGCPGAGGFLTSAVYNHDGGPSDGQWQWVWFAQKSSSASGNQCTSIQVQAGVPGNVYGVVSYFIPAGSKTDNDVLDLAWTMNSIDSACPVGSICNVAGHPLSVDALNIRASGFSSSFVAGPLTANRTYTFPDANGTVALFTPPKTNNNCANWVVSGGVTTLGDAGFACGSGGGGGSGTVNPANQFSIGSYPNVGNTAVIGGIPPPTTPASVPQFLISTPSSINAPTQGTFALAGIPVTSLAGASYSVVGPDRNSLLYSTFGSPSTVINVPATLFNNGFAFKVGARALNASVAITPSSGTCNGSANCTLLQGQNATVTLDPAGSNLLADVHDPPLNCLTGCSLTRHDYSLDLSVTGALAGSGTVGSLTKFVTNTTTIGNADLSGDVTTSGTTVATVPSVNGVTYQAGGALSANRVPVTTGASATTYQQVPAAAIVGGGATTVNGQTCTVNATCDVNTGAANHSMALNKGAGAAMTGVALTNQQIPSGVTGADPVAYNLSELSATLYGPTDTGTSTAFAACSTPAAAALHAGQMVEFLPAHANTSSNPTLAWCGLTPATIVSIAGGVLANNDIITTQLPLLLYDGTKFQLQNPQTNIIGGAVTWDVIGNAANNATLNNGAFTTTFNQTTNASWSWNNSTAAIIGTMQPSPTLSFSGKYCTVTVTCGSATDSWRIRPALTTGVNAATTFVIEHTGGTSGGASVQVPNLTTAGTITDTGLTASLPICTDGSKVLSSTCTGLITGATMANGTVTGTQIASSVALAGTPTVSAGSIVGTVASGTSAMGTSAITSGACATVVTTSATGTATTDVIVYTPNADPTALTGYGVSASGSLYIWAYPTTNNVNFKVCNNTANSITPSALTLNWKVVR